MRRKWDDTELQVARVYARTIRDGGMSYYAACKALMKPMARSFESIRSKLKQFNATPKPAAPI